MVADGMRGQAPCRPASLTAFPTIATSIRPDAEKAAQKTMMPCVSRCRGQGLVLDL
jgi:hypothetical protein